MLNSRIKFLASLYTIILIAVVIGLLLFSGFDYKSKPIKGQAIQAIMVDISQMKLNKSHKPPTKKNKPVKKAEIKKIKIKPLKKTDQIKPKKPAIVPKKKPTIIAKKQPEKNNTKALEKERKEQLERDKKKKALEKRKQDNKKKIEKAKRDLEALTNSSTKQIQDKNTQAKVANHGANEFDEKNKLLLLWINAVQSAVYQQWSQPASTAQDMQCSLKVKQIPGGAVVNVAITSPCNASEIVKKSIIDAIMKAEPLPYKGFEKVFDRNAIFTFKAQE